MSGAQYEAYWPPSRHWSRHEWKEGILWVSHCKLALWVLELSSSQPTSLSVSRVGPVLVSTVMKLSASLFIVCLLRFEPFFGSTSLIRIARRLMSWLSFSAGSLYSHRCFFYCFYTFDTLFFGHDSNWIPFNTSTILRWFSWVVEKLDKTVYFPTKTV